MDYYPFVDEFRQLLRDRLRERGALARLSEASGIASNVIGRWRDGAGRPTDVNLARLAPAIGVPYEELLKMCQYLPDGTSIPEHDPIEATVRTGTAEMYEAVRDVPKIYWATIIKASLERAIDGARDMAHLLIESDSRRGTVSTSADADASNRAVPTNNGPSEGSGPIKARYLLAAA